MNNDLFRKFTNKILFNNYMDKGVKGPHSDRTDRLIMSPPSLEKLK